MLIRRLILFVISIGAGLLSRSEFIQLPEFIGFYIGDVIWAFMVFWLFSILLFKYPFNKVLVASFAFSFVIEFSQLYHAPWIEKIRDIKICALVLGHGFLWSDLICYSVGIVLAYILERKFIHYAQH